ncbi:bifunctional 2-polyprenyl-6-hydroxyphenol methylase/3-demethylubiquinol 3-O-methyltransferase UbiG [Paenibacillus sp. XY044]|uniref:class I SAM-dependent methyltransferase n=1 Tax=Paenibacillus sp. XY044 TaxID=2026089 RepID=UPI000B99C88D|nr:class I SAM-dependent methyltransferase [Paenibacillus sp. XY044]OZB98342.1 ubiquinone biosynthesis methyltransferase UbiE [Paenibacillus sp. XY044]
MNNESINRRTELSGKLTDVLHARTLASSHPILNGMLMEGMSVLDVGCGTGAITRGIAEAVGPKGSVVGVDQNPHLIVQARQEYGKIPGLSFAEGDIYSLEEALQGYPAFDIVTCARLMVWLPDPLAALKAMVKAVKPGGRIVIADYNHEKIAWSPRPPASMLAFYSAYLRWREDAGLNNRIADDLPDLMRQAGLGQVTATPCHEAVRRDDPAYPHRSSLWADTASSRGPQMERDGFISRGEYEQAEREYRH